MTFSRLHRLTAAVSIGLFLSLAGASAFAQQTAGNLNGRILDAQGGALPGATVTAVNESTGYSRTVVSDEAGLYRLNALPVGVYTMTTELSGFTRTERKDVIVNVGQTATLDFPMALAGLEESVTVTGESPQISTVESAVGGLVDIDRIEDLPLNGRQFANLAVTIPGVGLGFHSDPTKSTQFSPQINGGNGRNVNYQIDGGDNNDDTVGGLLQLFPLEAIQEFNVQTARYKAEYGRSNGGVMNIVTKSGTNTLSGSWFTLFRDASMNARTESERLAEVEKQDYRRYQFGGSFGGPIVKDRAHFFVAAERTQQDTFQAVNTLGLFPNLDGVFSTPYRENLVTAKGTVQVSPSQYLSVRYGRNQNDQPYGADGRTPPAGWGQSKNAFNSINANHNWVLPFGFNEFILQYADFDNAISANSTDPAEQFPNGVFIGQNPNTPQATQQKKWQFRDDFTWHVTGMGGLGHDMKAGVNFINEPRLFITFNTGTGGPLYTHLTNDLNGPIQTINLNGGSAEANIPLRQYALYWQDDWRLTDRLTLNLGYRYDLNTGYDIEQALNPNYVILQNAARAGRFDVPGGEAFEGFGDETKNDTNNHQPRVGVVYDLFGTGRDVVRAGYGRYYDVSYTNASVLFAAIDATGLGSGSIFSVTNSGGIRNPDGSFFRVGQPLSNLNSQNEAGGQLPLIGHIASPLVKMPYSDQLSVGWSHQLGEVTAVDVDYVHSEGRDLGWRPRPNQRLPGAGATAPRRFADLGINPANFRTNVSTGESEYDGVNFGLRRRHSNGWSYNLWYSLSSAKSTTGNSSDELDSNNIIDITDPFGDVQFGPARRSDARHRFTASAVFEIPWGFQVSPIFRFQSALPVWIIENVDLNQDGQNNDLPDRAWAFDGTNDDGTPRIKDIGPCDTINCGRGAKFSQLNLRVSRTFPLGRDMRIEAIAEIFNVFNAINPGGFAAPTRRATSATDPTVQSSFLQPTEYAGDFQNPEQRVGQIGFRFIF